MMRIKYIFPLVLIVGTSLFMGCATKAPQARVRIRNAHESQKKIDTGYIKSLPKQVSWVDDKGKEHFHTGYSYDSVSGKDISHIQMGEVLVTARSKNVAERNGKVNLDFIITVPSELINNKWQLQLQPVAYKPNDTISLDKILLSGADFAKMQKKGYLQYQAFMNSIIPDSLYMEEMFNKKGYRRAMQDLEEEYFQAWKRDITENGRWIDWRDKMNQRFKHFNQIMESNKQSLGGKKGFRSILPAYWLRRELSEEFIPSKWQLFADEAHQIRKKEITPEDSLEIIKRFTDYKRIAENQHKREIADAMYEKYVRFPYEPARLDTVIKSGDSFQYYYSQELPATDNTKKIELCLLGQTVSKSEEITQLPPSDTITYYISSMVQFLDRSPRYKRQIITRKDEKNMTAYINFEQGSSKVDSLLGNNKEELAKIYDMVYKINFSGEFVLDSIFMTATSSPEGSSSLNEQLSKARALSLKSFIAKGGDAGKELAEMIRPQWIGEDWKMLQKIVEADDSIQNRSALHDIFVESLSDDLKEEKLKAFREDFMRMKELHYPRLRATHFKFYVHRKNIVQDTIVTTVIDEEYQEAMKWIEDRLYKKALNFLEEQYPTDYNLGICLMSLGYDARALEIMREQAPTSDRDYVMAILYMRLKQEKEALKYFVQACEADDSKIWRGKLDPEINTLITHYNLYADEYE